MGSLRVKIKLTVAVKPGLKVKYSEAKYKSTNYIDWVLFKLFFINNIDITFTIRTNNTYNTLEYNKRKKNSYIPYYDLQRKLR